LLVLDCQLDLESLDCLVGQLDLEVLESLVRLLHLVDQYHLDCLVVRYYLVDLLGLVVQLVLDYL